ncbi:MAG TPA: secondary thiamine-phosphate synthase enzyme YjbQ [Thermodesulfobacteriota bacterium]|nr:secondary thiamine-phosphate synthase enzyme YjbQ [Thermodesulfobacteriota bacterium]
MAVNTFGIELNTRGECDMIDITGYVEQYVTESELDCGTATVFVPGSTAGITTIEYESGAITDFKAAIERLAPTDIHYNHDARWGDGNGYSHVRAALLGPSLSVPFNSGRLLLGTWQQIVVVDFDNRPRNRKIVVQVIGD